MPLSTTQLPMGPKEFQCEVPVGAIKYRSPWRLMAHHDRHDPKNTLWGSGVKFDLAKETDF